MQRCGFPSLSRCTSANNHACTDRYIDVSVHKQENGFVTNMMLLCKPSNDKSMFDGQGKGKTAESLQE